MRSNKIVAHPGQIFISRSNNQTWNLRDHRHRQADQIEVLVAEVSRLRAANEKLRHSKAEESKGPRSSEANGALSQTLQKFDDLASSERAANDERAAQARRLEAAVTARLSQHEETMRDKELQIDRLQASLRQRDALIQERERHISKVDRLRAGSGISMFLCAQVSELGYECARRRLHHSRSQGGARLAGDEAWAPSSSCHRQPRRS